MCEPQVLRAGLTAFLPALLQDGHLIGIAYSFIEELLGSVRDEAIQMNRLLVATLFSILLLFIGLWWPPPISSLMFNTSAPFAINAPQSMISSTPVSPQQSVQSGNTTLDSRIVAAAITAAAAGLTALAGSYFGTRWGFRRFIDEQRYQRQMKKLDLLTSFLGETRAEIAEYLPRQQIVGGQIPQEVRDRIQRKIVTLNAAFINDPSITKPCGVLLRAILSDSTREAETITAAKKALDNLEQALILFEAGEGQQEE